MSNTFELTVTKNIPGPRKTVFEAWLDPKALAQFMKPGPGMTVPKAESDAKVGGTFLIVMKAGEKELPHRGEYKVIDRYDTLEFTWLSDHSGPESLVRLTFKEISATETELTLRHTGLPNEESRNNHEGGWSRIVEALRGFVA